MKQNNNMTIYPTNGLCNRLRTIFYYRDVTRKQNKQLTVLWVVNKYCNGKFNTIFKPIPGVRVIDMDINTGDPFMFNNKPFDYKGNGDKAWPYVAKVFETTEIQLQQNLQNQVDDIIHNIGSRYIALHIRKTDGLAEQIQISKKYNLGITHDEDRFNFVEKYSKLPIYISTDCEAVQQQFLDQYKKRIPVFHKINNNNNLRKTTLEQAAVDIMVCSKAYKFLGTKHSSFSALIDILGKFGRIIPSGKIGGNI